MNKYSTRRTHVIVGAGAGGLMLANSLLHYGDNVILIECGDDTLHLMNSDGSKKAIDWGVVALKDKKAGEGSLHTSEAQHNLRCRSILYPQGYGLGGTTNMNACIWTGGSPTVFNEHWPASWNAEKMQGWLETVRDALEPVCIYSAKGAITNTLKRGRKFSRKYIPNEEDQTEFESDYYNYDALTDDEEEAEDTESVWSAPAQSHYLATLDSNETRFSGNRLRLGELLKKHDGDGKLTLLTLTKAEFVVFEGKEAVAVAVTKTAKESRLEVAMESAKLVVRGAEEAALEHKLEFVKPSGGGEIILCAGVIETPRLLIASGLRGSVNAHPASRCGRSFQAVDLAAQQQFLQAQAQAEAQMGRGSSKSRKGAHYHLSSTSKSKLFTQKSPLPNLSGIGSQLQDHVLLPVLALGNWIIDPKEALPFHFGDLFGVLGVEGASTKANNEQGINSVDAIDKTQDSLERIRNEALRQHQYGYAYPLRGARPTSGSSAVNPMSAATASATSAPMPSNQSLLDLLHRLIALLARLMGWVLSMWHFLLFQVPWDVLNGTWVDKYYHPMHTWYLAISSQLNANGVHGWIDLDVQGNVIDRDRVGSQVPYAQLIFVDGGCGAGYIPELLLPRFVGSGLAVALYMDTIRPALYSLLKLITSFWLVKLLMRTCVFGCLVCLTNPRSKGRLYMKNRDPYSPLVMDLNLLSDRKDRKVLHNAMKTAHRFLEFSRQKDGLCYLELLPGLLFNYGTPDDLFDTYVSLFATTFFHACGTCSMSTIPLPQGHEDQALKDDKHEGGHAAQTIAVDKEAMRFVCGGNAGIETGSHAAGLPPNARGHERRGSEGPVPDGIWHSTDTSPSSLVSGGTEDGLEKPSWEANNKDKTSARACPEDPPEVIQPMQFNPMKDKCRMDKTEERTDRRGSYSSRVLQILAKDPTAVVDAKLRVIGVKSLRVADASVIPKIPTGPIAATCMAIGVAAAEFLQEKGN